MCSGLISCHISNVVSIRVECNIDALCLALVELDHLGVCGDPVAVGLEQREVIQDGGGDAWQLHPRLEGRQAAECGKVSVGQLPTCQPATTCLLLRRSLMIACSTDDQ